MATTPRGGGTMGEGAPGGPMTSGVPGARGGGFVVGGGAAGAPGACEGARSGSWIGTGSVETRRRAAGAPQPNAWWRHNNTQGQYVCVPHPSSQNTVNATP